MSDESAAGRANRLAADTLGADPASDRPAGEPVPARIS